MDINISGFVSSYLRFDNINTVRDRIESAEISVEDPHYSEVELPFDFNKIEISKESLEKIKESTTRKKELIKEHLSSVNPLKLDFKQAMSLHGKDITEIFKNEGNSLDSLFVKADWDKMFDSSFIQRLAIKNEVWSDRIKKNYDGAEKEAALERKDSILEETAAELFSQYADNFKHYFGDDFNKEEFVNNLYRIMNENISYIREVKREHQTEWDKMVNSRVTYEINPETCTDENGEVLCMKLNTAVTRYKMQSEDEANMDFFQNKLNSQLKDVEENLKEKSEENSKNKIEEMSYSELEYTSKTIASAYENLYSFTNSFDGITKSVEWGQAKAKMLFATKHALPKDFSDKLMLGLDRLINKQASVLDGLMQISREKIIESVGTEKGMSDYTPFFDNKSRQSMINLFAEIGGKSADTISNEYKKALAVLREKQETTYATNSKSDYLSLLKEDWNEFISMMPKELQDYRVKDIDVIV
ncbi:hypothetical protein U472_15330 [Orenia metallireducens]|uniref:Uncharacterized protein n=1 Tax=Orenia metallireducens TaxID=1413210 RepID=A0A1C0A6E3_9FIRM|nr:hypothetical protein [Orenia metallireducens]OCL25698.1 hypothetical protein U472_15330 [Orenia metallireducens]